MKKLFSFFILVAIVLILTAANAQAASTPSDLKKAQNAFFDVFNNRNNATPEKALELMLAVKTSGLTPYQQGHRAMYLGDLYYRLDDYAACKEWLLKIFDDPDFYNISVSLKTSEDDYGHGVAVGVMLANAAATNGKPEDIDYVESKISKDDLSRRVSIWYCWLNRDRNTLRTLLRFYKALAYKNAGDLDAMREVMSMASFKAGKIRVGNKEMPLDEAARLFL